MLTDIYNDLSSNNNLFIVSYQVDFKMSTNLKKVILITGCDSGFGFSLACHMSENPQNYLTLACCYIPNSEGATILQSKPNLKVLPLDVTNENSIQDLVKQVNLILEEENSQLWAIVNNAATLVFADATWQTL